MYTRSAEFARGFAALRLALADLLYPAPALACAGVTQASPSTAVAASWLMSEALDYHATTPEAGPPGNDSDLACSSEEDEAAASRLIALVELARGGDSEAFGMLYDHYNASVYRFIYYRVGSVALAEDLASETFFRALRSMSSFKWQGKDFGAWLMTIARNLTADHYKAGRTRLEFATEDMGAHDSATEGPETAVLASLTNEALLEALGQLPTEQQECLIMRFLQGLSIAETAKVLGRSDGAVKQLQLRGVRNLAKLLPEGLR
ncbi:MAG TPA: sigma-70 family RNA polymerase sigma factor [Nocardioidaceae bacterium]|nr:sigma-70 family RNA polymerase sigma factor [Nocardioidaceae bacterium]